MKVIINRQPNSIDADTISIVFEEKKFIIKLDKFGELIINKCSYGEDLDAITIFPKVSNEIGLK